MNCISLTAITPSSSITGRHHLSASAAHSQPGCGTLADYASLHDTINKILARCSHVQQRLSTSNALSLNDSKPQSPTYISTRSRLLFELPSGAEAAATYKTDSMHMTPNSKQDVSTLCATDDSGSLAAAQQEHKTQVQQCARSWGGAVDLNPGFSFRPGEGLAYNSERRVQAAA